MGIPTRMGIPTYAPPRGGENASTLEIIAKLWISRNLITTQRPLETTEDAPKRLCSSLKSRCFKSEGVSIYFHLAICDLKAFYTCFNLVICDFNAVYTCFYLLTPLWVSKPTRTTKKGNYSGVEEVLWPPPPEKKRSRDPKCKETFSAALRCSHTYDKTLSCHWKLLLLLFSMFVIRTPLSLLHASITFTMKVGEGISEYPLQIPLRKRQCRDPKSFFIDLRCTHTWY